MQTSTGFEMRQQRGGQAAIANSAELQAAELQTIDTQYGSVRVNLATLMLGELLVTDEGAELEVIGLAPLDLVLAPEEEEDWGE